GQLGDRLRRGKDREKRRKSLFNQARYHLKRVQAEPKADHEYDWRKIIEAIGSLVDEGLPPSNIELRDFLLPILDDIPEGLEFPKGVQLVMREIDRYLSSRPAAESAGAEPPPTPDVSRTRELLRGRSIVLIGGDRRPYAAEALEAAFELRELIWIE